MIVTGRGTTGMSSRIRITAITALGLATVLGLTPENAPAQRPSDMEITRSLQNALGRDFRLKEAEIQVSTMNRFVTLRGRVTSYLDKQTAEQIARRTAGVGKVLNMIRVESDARRDEQIAADVRRRLKQSSFIGPMGLTVQVEDGVVTLTGSVETWAQSRQAQMVAGEVRGVKQVRNKATVAGSTSSATARTDATIKSAIEAELQRDAYLAGLTIDVSVEAGVVRLEGEVPNLFHRELAGDEARLIANVRDVDNRLVIVGPGVSDELPEPAADSELEELVLSELRADPRTAAGEVQVVSSGGRVTLRGSVGSMFERETIERITRSVSGVLGVENQLEVNTTPRGDAEIRADIESNWRSDSWLAGQPVTVAVMDGVVVLSGEVSDYTRKNHAARLAARVAGVRSIDNGLKVIWSASTNDESVKLRIVERLRSNAITRPVAGRIRVSVSQGAVTLAGMVERSSQSIEAERIARGADGVRAVENGLAISRPSGARR